MKNKFSQTAYIIFRVKLLGEEDVDSYLAKEEIEYIKEKYPFTQWFYRIALRELELGLIEEQYEIKYL
jgi:hypothetical protein